MLIDHHNMTESIYETRQEIVPDCPKLFEDFLTFELPQEGQEGPVCKYRYNRSSEVEELVSSLLDNV